MPDAMPVAMPDALPGVMPPAMHATHATQRNSLTHPRPRITRQVPDASKAVDNDDSLRFLILKRATPESGHHKFWLVYAVSGYRKRRVACYLRWEMALHHVETAVRRFGRGYL